jgi:DNA-binding FrmR family transcriptional regulator
MSRSRRDSAIDPDRPRRTELPRASAPDTRGGPALDERTAPLGPTLGKHEQQTLASHLHRIEGQLRGIQRMIEEPRRCVDILQQLAAVEAALGRVSVEVFRAHVEESMGPHVAAAGRDPREGMDEVLAIVDKYSRLAKLGKV